MTSLPPTDTKRWTPGRKAAVIDGIMHGKITMEEALRRYQMTAAELAEWWDYLIFFGEDGLRVTRLREYRAQMLEMDRN